MNKYKHVLIIFLLCIILTLNIFLFFKKDGAWQLEEFRVGGPENLNKAIEFYNSDYYKTAQTKGVEDALSQLATSTNTNDNVTPTYPAQVILDELSEIKKSSSIYGEKSARFTILEYSELLCSYCKRQSDQGILEEVMNIYPYDVNTIFRNFIVHSQATKLGEAILCVGELQSKSQHDFIKKAFADEVTSVEMLIEVADKLGINKQKLQSCIDSGKYDMDVINQTNEGRHLFGINGTPGNVIIDSETGEYVVIPGAFPVEKFIEEIEKLKNR